GWTMARPGYGPGTIPATMLRLYSIRTGIASKPCATHPTRPTGPNLDGPYYVRVSRRALSANDMQTFKSIGVHPPPQVTRAGLTRPHQGADNVASQDRRQFALLTGHGNSRHFYREW